MPSYTPLPIPFSYHIEDYGLHNATVDGLLIARAIAVERDSQDAYSRTSKIVQDIDKMIEKAKALSR